MATLSMADDNADLEALINSFLMRCYLALKRDGTLLKPPRSLLDQLDPKGRDALAARMEAFRIAEPRKTSKVEPPRLGTSATWSRRFRIGRRIGKGGMGVVFEADDLLIGRKVAVKVLRKELLGQAVDVDRFRQEAKIAGSLEHPSIPPIHDFGTLRGGRPCIAMQLIEGRTLAERLAGRSSTVEGISDWLVAFELVCRAVAHAHALGVIHRDLKSANIKIGESGEVWVLDWGLAKDTAAIDGVAGPSGLETPGKRPADSSLTEVGTILGTFHSMAPEQARGHFDLIKEQTDVFALGSILCEILTGSPAYVGTADEIGDRARRADLVETHDRLRSVPISIDRDLVNLAMSCLSEAPADRPRGARELAEVIAAHRRSIETRARDAEESHRRSIETRARDAREARRRFRIVSIAAASLSVVLVLLSVTLVAVVYQVNRAVTAERKAEATARSQDRSIRVLSRFAADPRLADPGLITLQADLLGEAIPALEDYRRLAGGAEADKQLSRALIRMADVYRVRGESEESLRLLSAAERYFAALVASGGSSPDPEAVYGLAVTRGIRGVVLGKTRTRTDEAAGLFRQAATGFSALKAAGWGDVTDLRRRLTLCLNGEGNCLRFADPEVSVQAYEKVLAEFRQLVAANPDDALSRLWEIKAASNLAIELEIAGRFVEARKIHDEAEKSSKEAIDRVDKALASKADPGKDPWLLQDKPIREARGIALSNLGSLLGRLAIQARAEAVFQDALRTYQGLSRSAPDSFDYAWNLAMARSDLGHLLDGIGPSRQAEAEGLLDQSHAWYAMAVEKTPDDNELAVYRGGDLLRLAELQSHRPGDPSVNRLAAIQTAREALSALGRAGDTSDAGREAAEARIFLGDLLLANGELAPASAEWRTARSKLVALIASQPKVPCFVLDLARVEARLARVATREGRDQDSAPLRQQARLHLAEARKRSPDDPGLRRAESEVEGP